MAVKAKAKVVKEIKAKKPEMPDVYADGDVNMHSSMITTKANFERIWGRKLRAGLDAAWLKAKAFKDSHR